MTADLGKMFVRAFLHDHASTWNPTINTYTCASLAIADSMFRLHSDHAQYGCMCGMLCSFWSELPHRGTVYPTIILLFIGLWPRNFHK